MRRFLASIVILIILLFNVAVANAAETASKATFDTASLSSGIIKVSYTSDSDMKLKVLVEKGNNRISYNLRNDGTFESFPLQLGNGDYKVSVMENVEGDKYKYASTENVSLNLKEQTDAYLGSVQNINWNEDMAAIKKAGELTKGLKSDDEKIRVIYEYIVDNLKYDYDKLSKVKYDYLPNIDSTLASGKGICYDYSSTFAAMLRSVGIPAKLVKGYTKSVDGYHAWNEVYDRETGTWKVIDTTYDSQMKALKGKYAMVKKSAEYDKKYEY